MTIFSPYGNLLAASKQITQNDELACLNDVLQTPLEPIFIRY